MDTPIFYVGLYDISVDTISSFGYHGEKDYIGIAHIVRLSILYQRGY